MTAAEQETRPQEWRRIVYPNLAVFYAAYTRGCLVLVRPSLTLQEYDLGCVHNPRFPDALY